jgi:hypothetical protein
MPAYRKLAGTTNVSIDVLFFTVATGAPVTVTTATAGLSIKYRRQGATLQNFPTLNDLAALDSAWDDGGILLIENGLHRLDIPDAACAAGASHVSIEGAATGIAMIPVTIDLVAYNPYDAVRLGLTALPNVASGSAGAIPTTGTGANQIAVSSGTVLLSSDTEGQIDNIETNLLTYLLGFATFGTIDDTTPAATEFQVSTAFINANDTYNGLHCYVLSGNQKGRRGEIYDQVGLTLFLRNAVSGSDGLTAAPENGAVIAIMP